MKQMFFCRSFGVLHDVARLSARTLISMCLVSVLLLNPVTVPSAKASLRVTSLFWHICIYVSELEQDLTYRDRNELAAQVGSAIQIKVQAVSPGRIVRALPNCIKGDQPGYDRQLMLMLSVKRQTTKVDGQDRNVVIAGGVSIDGLFQDRHEQPVVIVQKERVSDDDVVKALIEFVDRSIVEALRRSNIR
jgi:hypothetical protein